MHSWTDATGQLHLLPRIEYEIESRLKQWGVVDLYSLVTRPEKWEETFERMVSDSAFIVNMLHALEHETRGSDEQQKAFCRLFSVTDPEAERGTTDIIREASEALLGAVVDFFPSDHRASIQQFVQMFLMERATKTFQTGADSEASFSATPESGSNGCSEQSDTRDPVSV